MRYRKLSSTGDYTFGNGVMDFYKDTPEAPTQAVKTRLLLWLSEWFLDIEEGTPWLEGVLGKQQLSTIDTVIRTRILETEGVSSIISYESTIDSDNRRLSILASIDTIYGITNFEAAI